MITVLLVEDDPDIAALVANRFSFDAPGEFALRTITRDFEQLLYEMVWDDIDVLVLDLWLEAEGFIEGYPLAHRIVSYVTERKPALPIVVFSAVVGLTNSDIEDLVTAVVHKPNVERLAPLIRELANR